MSDDKVSWQICSTIEKTCFRFANLIGCGQHWTQCIRPNLPKTQSGMRCTSLYEQHTCVVNCKNTAMMFSHQGTNSELSLTFVKSDEYRCCYNYLMAFWCYRFFLCSFILISTFRVFRALSRFDSRFHVAGHSESSTTSYRFRCVGWANYDTLVRLPPWHTHHINLPFCWMQERRQVSLSLTRKWSSWRSSKLL